ncbi:MAG: hypothetical protein JKY31_09825, partial [Rhodobacteraceae bacterium]|nr:hypothetical protein [Paracoccaceae bacterium]
MASIAGLTFSTAAIAGNIEIPETITVAPVASTAADWSGFYVGGMAGRDNGTLAYSNSPGSNPPPQFYYPSIATYGGLAGFNVQRGNLVFGGEAAIHSGGMFIEPFDNEATSAIIDLKGRVGFAVGN